MSDLIQFPRRIKLYEAAARLGISSQSLLAAVAKGEVDGAAKIGQAWTFNPDKLTRPAPQWNLDYKYKSNIYFIRCSDFVKIGITSGGIKSRLDAMRVGNPYDLELLHSVAGDAEAEQYFHRRFVAYHHRGEWFRYEGDLKDWLNSQIVEAA